MPTPRAAEAALRNSSPVANRVNLSNLAIIDLSATSNVHRTASTLRKVLITIVCIVVIVYHKPPLLVTIKLYITNEVDPSQIVSTHSLFILWGFLLVASNLTNNFFLKLFL